MKTSFVYVFAANSGNLGIADAGKGSYYPLLDLVSFSDRNKVYILLCLFFAGGVEEDEMEEGVWGVVGSSSNY